MTEVDKGKLSTLANYFREDVELGPDDKINDINEIVDKAGYKYYEGSFEKEFSAMCLSQNPGEFLIIFNKDHHHNESFKRFSIAHEIAHLTIPEHRTYLRGQKSHISSAEFQSNSQWEREADYFAISLLAPKKSFQRAIRTREFTAKDILEISDEYEISILASAIRFVELTDLACSLVMTDKNKKIKYEYRSNRMHDALREIRFIPLLNRSQLNHDTHTYSYLDNPRNECERVVKLHTWYPEVFEEVEATESVIELGYNDTFLTLLNPLTVEFVEPKGEFIF